MGYPDMIIIFSAIFASIVLVISSIEFGYWLYKWITDRCYDGFYSSALMKFLDINDFSDLSIATFCFLVVSFLMGLVWPLSVVVILIFGGAFGTRHWFRMNKEKELR